MKKNKSFSKGVRGKYAGMKTLYVGSIDRLLSEQNEGMSKEAIDEILRSPTEKEKAVRQAIGKLVKARRNETNDD